MFWLALLIFLAETSVVTLDTVRVIFIGRGYRVLSALLGMVVVSIWLFAISQIMQNLQSPYCFIAYAVGYTTGIFLGMSIEERLALGCQLVRIFAKQDATKLIQQMRQAKFGVTSVEAKGASGMVHVIFTIVPRKKLDIVLNMIHQFDDKSFYTIEDVRRQQGGFFPNQKHSPLGVPFESLAATAPIISQRDAA